MFRKGKYFIGGFVVGVATGSVVRELTPVFKEVATPAFRAFIKAGVVIYERGQDYFWETYESIEDVIAEAKLDVQEARDKKMKMKEGTKTKKNIKIDVEEDYFDINKDNENEETIYS